MNLTDLASANGVIVNEKKISPGIKTRYNPIFTLFFGTIEVSRIAIDEVQSVEETIFEKENAVKFSTCKSSLT
jgi:hypothetical protein